MLIVRCPERGPTIVGYAALRSMVNIEPGVVALRWSCPCGGEHVAATGKVAEADPVRAAAAVDAVRRAAGLEAGDEAGEGAAR